MRFGRLPTLRAARSSLLKNGEIAGIDKLITLSGFFYEHPTKGALNVAVDPRIFKHTTLYLNHKILEQLLKKNGARVQPIQQAVKLLQSAYRDRSRFIWGVSGYASAGHPYQAHHKILKAFYNQLKKPQHRPAFITDGGGKAGVLGLNGVMAKERKIPTIGMVPYQGLNDLAWRDHTIVGENSFQNREKWVGRLPDILLCVLGGEGTMRERHEAALQGAVIVDLIPHTYPSLPTSKLVTCRSISDIPRCIAEAEVLARAGLENSRKQREKTFPQLLTA